MSKIVVDGRHVNVIEGYAFDGVVVRAVACTIDGFDSLLVPLCDIEEVFLERAQGIVKSLFAEIEKDFERLRQGRVVAK